MLRFLKGFFRAKHPDVTPVAAPPAPYKVEPPVTPAVVNPEVFPQIFVDSHGDVQEVKSQAKPKRAPAKKAAPKKPAAMKAPAKPKTPRKPRATK